MCNLVYSLSKDENLVDRLGPRLGLESMVGGPNSFLELVIPKVRIRFGRRFGLES